MTVLKRFAVILILAFGGMAQPVLAVQPDEMLDDPAEEARAREISAGLR
jgi:cytochrome c-type biogenesis protein CcmH